MSPDDRDLIAYYQKRGFPYDSQLLDFVESFFPDKSGHLLHLPRRSVCPEHDSPADYLCDVFFERVINSVVWANRGAGKTLLAGLETWLDSVFKANCSTRILGGSLDQANKVYQHLTGKGEGWQLVNDTFRYLVSGEMLKADTSLVNGSNIEILPASDKRVRGTHPQKAKLDEIDEMDPGIYQAALSIAMPRLGIKAATHIYSTMHKSYGLMQQIIEEAPERGFRVYKWCVLDTLERCVGRDCRDCYLWEDCRIMRPDDPRADADGYVGRALDADGFRSIEDIITKKRQVSEQTWLSEYLCRVPSSEGLIYGDFDLMVHVVEPPDLTQGDPEDVDL